jgi:alpha/beta superfamily hydrolase
VDTHRPESVAFGGRGGALEGRWWSGRGVAVVAPPHPEYGGRLDNPVVEALAAALARSGLAALAFNWRGVGASEGEPTGDLRAADDDFAAGVSYATRRAAPPPLVAAGYSFGAAAALRQPAADRLVLVAPPIALLGADELRSCARPLLVLVGDGDAYAPADLVADLVPKRPDARLEILRGVDHFFAAPHALGRLADSLAGALA